MNVLRDPATLQHYLRREDGSVLQALEGTVVALSARAAPRGLQSVPDYPAPRLAALWCGAYKVAPSLKRELEAEAARPYDRAHLHTFTGEHKMASAKKTAAPAAKKAKSSEASAPAAKKDSTKKAAPPAKKASPPADAASAAPRARYSEDSKFTVADASGVKRGTALTVVEAAQKLKKFTPGQLAEAAGLELSKAVDYIAYNVRKGIFAAA